MRTHGRSIVGWMKAQLLEACPEYELFQFLPRSQPLRLPRLLFFRLLIDGAGSCGFIIRNHLGESVLAGAPNISPVLDVLSTEMACLFALESAKRMAFSGVRWKRIPANCGRRSCHMPDLAPGVVLFRSIREFLDDRFHCNKILNIPRSCNSSAHKIAKVALSWDLGQSSVWNEPLLEIVNVLVTRGVVEFTSVNERP